MPNGDWDEVFVTPRLEVIHLHRQRKIGERIVQRERVLELPLFVARIHLAPDLAGVIARR